MNLKNDFLAFLNDKFANNEKLLDEITMLDCLYDYDAFSYAYELYEFGKSLNTKYYNQEVAKSFRKYIKDANYEEAFKIVYDEYKHAAIIVDMKWILAPSKLKRKVIIPLRYHLNEIIYITLALFGCDGYHLAELTDSYGEEYILENEFEDRLNYYDEEEIKISNNELFSNFIQHNKKCVVCYDYGDNYEFNLIFKDYVYLEDENVENFATILKAKGYGIFEDNIMILEEFLQNPDGYSEKFGEYYKDLIPFDFEDVDVKNLQDNLYGNIIMLVSQYENLEMIDENNKN